MSKLLDSAIRRQSGRGFATPYHFFTHTMDTARNNYEYSIAGTALYIEDVSDKALATIGTIRFNSPVSPAIPIRNKRLIRCPFNSFFITHSALTGKSINISVAYDSYGSETERDFFDIIDNSDTPDTLSLLSYLAKEISGTSGAVVYDRTVGLVASLITGTEATTVNNRRILESHWTNTGRIFVGVTPPTITSQFIFSLGAGEKATIGSELKAGLYAISNVAGQLLQVTRMAW